MNYQGKRKDQIKHSSVFIEIGITVIIISILIFKLIDK